MRHTPQRTCVGCRAARAKRELIRVVRTPEGEFRVDFHEKLPGRGAYVCAEASCLERALKRKALDRALKEPVPPRAASELEASLKAHIQAAATATGHGGVPSPDDEAERAAGTG